MRYTVDCEFDGHGGPIISVAVVPEEGQAFYGTTYHKPLDPWVAENVIPYLDSVPHHKMIGVLGTPAFVRRSLRDYLAKDEHPVFVSDSPVDTWRLAEMLSTGDDKGWHSTGFPRISFEVHNVICWPNDLGPKAVQHNAYWDAVALWAALNKSVDSAA